MKRLISTLLVVTMLLGTMVGCGNKETNGENGNNGEKVTLTVGVPQNANITDYEDNAFTKYLEETLNMDLEIVMFAGASNQYTQQFSLMASSGEELPDVFINFSGMPKNTIDMYGQDGYIMELTDLIEKYATNYKAQLELLDKDEKWRIDTALVSSEDEGIYAMPQYSDVFSPELMQNKMMINQEWLDKLGLKEPTNINELYSVLQAFATKDPNGNGQADEIPMLASSDQEIAMYILNAFMYYNKAENFNVDNGKLYTPATTNEYRKGLQFVNKLVSENLLSNLSYTITKADAKSLLSPSDQVAKVGIWCGHPETSLSADCTILDQYEPLSPLDDATGKGGYGVVNGKGLSFGSFISAECENPEAAMRFLDAWYLDETVRRSRHGEPGVDWERVDGESLFGTKSEIEITNAQAFFKGNATWGIFGPGIFRLENTECVSQMGKESLAGDTAEMFKKWYDEMQTDRWKQPENLCRSLRYTQEETEKADSAAWISYIAEARTLFCTGVLDPNSDSDWNEYLNKLEEYGQSRILGVAQTVYDRQYK